MCTIFVKNNRIKDVFPRSNLSGQSLSLKGCGKCRPALQSGLYLKAARESSPSWAFFNNDLSCWSVGVFPVVSLSFGVSVLGVLG